MGCVFCGRKPPEVKMSKEHVFPAWLEAHLPDAEPTRHVHDFSGRKVGQDDEIVTRGAPSKPFGHEARVVCVPCNTGWMHKMEIAVEPILIPLMRGEPADLSWGSCKTLAAWTFKTAAMASCLGLDIDRGVPQEHFEAFFRQRRLPPYTRIWAVPTLGGPRSGDWAKYVAFLGNREERARAITESIPANTYGIGFMLGTIGFVVFGTSRPDVFTQLRIVVNPALGMTQFWPRGPKDRLEWPTADTAVSMDWIETTVGNMLPFFRSTGAA